MLRAGLTASGEAPALELHGLNDVTVTRGRVARPLYLTLTVDGVQVVRIRADGFVVASATGSTGYSLSAGGPVLPPTSQEIVVTAVAPHLSRVRPLVLPGTSILGVTAEFDHEAVVSIDGQVNRALTSGDTIQIEQSPYRANLVRLGAASHFYTLLNHYLDSAVQD